MPDRIQQEIEDILRRIGGSSPKRPPSSRLRRAIGRFWRRLAGLAAALPRPRVSPGHLMLLGGVLIIAGYVFEVGSPDIDRWLIIAGFIILLLAFLLSWRRGARVHVTEKRWRGQRLDLDQGVGDRLRSWWGRRRGRR